MKLPASVAAAETVQAFCVAMIIRRYAYLRADNPGPTTHFAEYPIWKAWWKTHRPQIAMNALRRGTFGNKLPQWDDVAAAIDQGQYTINHKTGKEIVTPAFQKIIDGGW